ncbi:unnamed protein product [Rotaria magnacalcarata]|uniref:Uncharacterized protein n=1 Tax=Rotaria magnacalcarata TaxID=392030 RepID=A0A816X135_9BILA|nr:unnamed protein product [Rotaria magnacalcarata]
MTMKQQRSDGSLVRIFSAHTTMRYRLIQKKIKLRFHGEFLRAIRDNKIETIFQTNLPLKSVSHQSDNDVSYDL